ncbi:hypothetical protein SAMN05428987_5242 [Paenibacillus sp. CF095]|uniref:GIY-YIG nuclease family protein n=1 Tax=Paenibacillus sp. CF095 TaxID=1881033 RepID=UPI00087E3236|nr:GIY-YIG nuclease family protein [Paenibacillus sp. CF095]SDD54878.1 hypothetical protein SAMN05428987_5242 [Paenibacillus sp. CF095]
MLTKKDLLKQWLNNHQQYSFSFPLGNVNLEQTVILKQIEQLIEGSLRDNIYILYIVSELDIVPVYVGRSNNPLNRWKAHFKGLVRGQGLYEKWNSLLLDNAGKFKYEVGLFVVADSVLSQPPIPGVPCTIGSVEYQLVSLISDTYPKTLLNHEGNRR